MGHHHHHTRLYRRIWGTHPSQPLIWKPFVGRWDGLKACGRGRGQSGRRWDSCRYCVGRGRGRPLIGRPWRRGWGCLARAGGGLVVLLACQRDVKRGLELFGQKEHAWTEQLGDPSRNRETGQKSCWKQGYGNCVVREEICVYDWPLPARRERGVKADEMCVEDEMHSWWQFNDRKVDNGSGVKAIYLIVTALSDFACWRPRTAFSGDDVGVAGCVDGWTFSGTSGLNLGASWVDCACAGAGERWAAVGAGLGLGERAERRCW
jgi:hypothetical protein